MTQLKGTKDDASTLAQILKARPGVAVTFAEFIRAAQPVPDSADNDLDSWLAWLRAQISRIGSGDSADLSDYIRIESSLPDPDGYEDGQVIEVGGQLYRLLDASAARDFAGTVGAQQVHAADGIQTVYAYQVPYAGDGGHFTLGESTYNPNGQVLEIGWEPAGHSGGETHLVLALAAAAYAAIPQARRTRQYTEGLTLRFMRTDGTQGTEDVRISALSEAVIDTLVNRLSENPVWTADNPLSGARPEFTKWGSFDMSVLIGDGTSGTRFLDLGGKVWNALHDPVLAAVSKAAGEARELASAAIQVRQSLPASPGTANVGDVVYVDGNLYEATHSPASALAAVPGSQNQVIAGIDNRRWGYVSPLVPDGSAYGIRAMGEARHNPLVDGHAEVLAVSARQAGTGGTVTEASVYVIASVAAYEAAKSAGGNSPIARNDPLTISVAQSGQATRTVTSLRHVGALLQFGGEDYAVFTVAVTGASWAAIQTAHAAIANFVDAVKSGYDNDRVASFSFYAAPSAATARKLSGSELGWTQAFDSLEERNRVDIAALQGSARNIQSNSDALRQLQDVTTDLQYGIPRVVSWAPVSSGMEGVALRSSNWGLQAARANSAWPYSAVAAASASIVNLDGQSYIALRLLHSTDPRLRRINVLDPEGRHAWYIYPQQMGNLGNSLGSPVYRYGTVWKGAGTDGAGPIPEGFSVRLEAPDVTTHVGQTVFSGMIADSVNLARRVKVGDTLALDNALNDGPDMSSLKDQLKLKFSYTRETNAVVMWTDWNKSDVEAGANCQLQGAGGAFVRISEANGKIRFTDPSISTITGASVEIYNDG